jgi:hypothetical protein
MCELKPEMAVRGEVSNKYGIVLLKKGTLLQKRRLCCSNLGEKPKAILQHFASQQSDTEDNAVFSPEALKSIAKRLGECLLTFKSIR